MTALKNTMLSKNQLLEAPTSLCQKNVCLKPCRISQSREWSWTHGF